MYAAEFSALCMATEEAVALRYMLQCLGCNIPPGRSPTKIFGDNFSVIQNASKLNADLFKKHVAISYHTVREAIMAGVIEPNWLKGKWNLSNIVTKQIPREPFLQHCGCLFWRPNFPLHENNQMDEDYDSL